VVGLTSVAAHTPERGINEEIQKHLNTRGYILTRSVSEAPRVLSERRFGRSKKIDGQ
jgi:hypothetical protein